MTVKRIWLVRHGQSQSQTGESDDHLNPPLSDLGIVQAGEQNRFVRYWNERAHVMDLLA